MEDCVFCKIIKNEIPREMFFEDQEIAVFPSNDPRAPLHLLLIPKNHIEDLKDLSNETLVKIKDKILEIVEQKNLTASGYRVVTNGGSAKMVSHLHFHLLGEVTLDREV